MFDITEEKRVMQALIVATIPLENSAKYMAIIGIPVGNGGHWD